MKKLLSNFIPKVGQQGVTLMETLVALSILIAGVFAGMSLMISTLAYSQRSEQSITVVNLAREGIEIVRAVRENDGFANLNDGSYIVDSSFYTDLGQSALGCGNPCQIVDCTNCLLYINNGQYVHTASSQTTIFKRMITISSPSAWEKMIISEVYWTEHGRQHSFKLENHLTDWRN